VQRQQLWVRQQNPLSQSKLRRCVLSRQNGCPSIAHDRGGTRSRGSRRRKCGRCQGHRRGQHRSGSDRSFWRLRRCSSSPSVRRSGTAIATDDVGQLHLERLPLRIGHFLRCRRERKVVSRIVADETELQSDLGGAFFAAEKRCGWVSGGHARGMGFCSQEASWWGTRTEGAFLPSWVHCRWLSVSSSVPSSFL